MDRPELPFLGCGAAPSAESQKGNESQRETLPGDKRRAAGITLERLAGRDRSLGDKESRPASPAWRPWESPSSWRLRRAAKRRGASALHFRVRPRLAPAGRRRYVRAEEAAFRCPRE